MYSPRSTRAFVRSLCARHGITQAELARMWGVSRQGLSNRLSRPSRNLAYDLAIEFSLPLDLVVQGMTDYDSVQESIGTEMARAKL